MNNITATFAAQELGFSKMDGLWWSDFYLNNIEYNPYGLGSKVYLGDGEELQENGLTDEQLIQEYNDGIEELKNEGF